MLIRLALNATYTFIGKNRVNEGPTRTLARKRRLLIVAFSNTGGGAAAATSRIFGALLRHSDDCGLDVRLWTMSGVQAPTERHLLGPPRKSNFHRFFERSLWFLRRGPRHFLFRRPSFLATTADIPTGAGRSIRQLNPEVVNLHWLGNRTISIQEVGRLGIPTVWTLSDEWLVSSGTLHYALENGTSLGQRFADLWVGFLKRAYLSRLFVIVKSERLAKAVRSSPLAPRIYLAVMPNPIDVDFWNSAVRRGFRAGKTVHLGFGYSGRKAGFRKGADFVGPLLSGLLSGRANTRGWKFKLSLFGDASIETVPNIPRGVEVSVLGAIAEEALRELYSNLDFLLVPSRLDNTPNVVIEGMATGAIVVAREGSGAEELLDGGRNGVVWAAGESADQLAIRLLSLAPHRAAKLGSLAALKVRESCSEATYATRFARLLEGVLHPEVAEAHGWEVPCA